MRLNQYLAKCGVASRRKCDDIITSGRVGINGKTITTLGTDVNIVQDEVTVDGQVVKPVENKIYIVLHKPVGCVTSVIDTHKRPTVLDLVSINERIYPVGRLDINSEGVLLLTNDGDAAYKLLHPKYKVEKTYRVTLNKAIKKEDIIKLENGIMLEDGETAPCKINSSSRSSDEAQDVVITIREGRKRQVRRMFEAVGYKVTRLCRIAFGPVTLDNLPVGKWRHLTSDEIKKLLRA